MRKLTESQITYLKGFFHDEYPEISDKLLRKGKCVVAGEGKLWHGGIGNFIRITDAEDFVDCKQLNFDVDMFLSSEWFKEVLIDDIEQYNIQLINLTGMVNDLKLLKS